MTSFNVKLTIVSPIHIGSGRADLHRNVDFINYAKKTYFLNVDQVLDYILPENEADSEQFDTIMRTMRFDSYLKEKDLTDHPELYRYRVWENPSLNEVRPQQQTAFGELYIPGSTLKGALRTAWIRSQMPTGVDERQLGQRREWAFRSQESAMMSGEQGSKAPNYDLFRAIQVADSQGIAANGVATIINAAVVPAGPKGIPIVIEAIDAQSEFTARIKFDEYLLEKQAQQLRWGSKAQIIRELFTLCREQGLKRLEQEQIFWHRRDKTIENWYAKAAQAAKDSHGAYIELGWGTGWMSKTLGQTLKDLNPQLLPKLIERYRMSRGKGGNGTFPGTRRVACDARNQPLSPLGWVRLDWEEPA